MANAKYKNIKRTTLRVNSALPDVEHFRWEHFGTEGELAVDIAQTKKDLVIVAPIAGVDPDQVSIAIDHDVLTIRGVRERAMNFGPEDYFYQECYWGAFSRSIILPIEVIKEKAKAKIEHGTLTISIPKAKATSEIPIEVIE